MVRNLALVFIILILLLTGLALSTTTNGNSTSPLATTSTVMADMGKNLFFDEVEAKVTRIEQISSRRMKTPSKIGSIKIAIAGDSGIGKTSLVSKISESDFVTEQSSIVQEKGQGISELKVSTLSKPPQNLDNLVNQTEYNLTLVDTPGFGAHMDAMITIQPIINYLSTQFGETQALFHTSFSSDDNDSLLERIISSSSGGHNHVDVCVYGILHRLKPVDKEFLRLLSPYAAIVPVIVKSDTLDKAEVFRLKVSVLEELKKHSIDVFSFGLDLDECHLMAKQGVAGAIPFAISNADQIDIDGRLNELNTLKEKILLIHSDEIRRQNAARFVKWREADLHQRIEGEKQKQQQQLQILQEQQKQQLQQPTSVVLAANAETNVSPQYGGGRPAIGVRLSSHPAIVYNPKSLERLAAIGGDESPKDDFPLPPPTSNAAGYHQQQRSNPFTSLFKPFKK